MSRQKGVKRGAKDKDVLVIEAASGTIVEKMETNGETSEPSTAMDVAGGGEADGSNKTDAESSSSTDWERLKKLTDKEITKKDLQVAAAVALASAAVKAKVRAPTGQN